MKGPLVCCGCLEHSGWESLKNPSGLCGCFRATVCSHKLSPLPLLVANSWLQAVVQFKVLVTMFTVQNDWEPEYLKDYLSPCVTHHMLQSSLEALLWVWQPCLLKCVRHLPGAGASWWWSCHYGTEIQFGFPADFSTEIQLNPYVCSFKKPQSWLFHSDLEGKQTMTGGGFWVFDGRFWYRSAFSWAYIVWGIFIIVLSAALDCSSQGRQGKIF